MKKFLLMPALLAGLFLLGCQKENFQPELALAEADGINQATQENCGDCVDSYTDTRETVPFGRFDLSLVAEQNATGLNYLHLVRSAGTFTKLAYTVTFHDVSAGTTTTLLSHDDQNSGGGNSNDRDLLRHRNGSDLSIADFPANWSACDYVTVTFTEVDGVGFGNNESIAVNYYLAELCGTDSECEAFRYETAYGGNERPESNTAWWYYFDVNGPETQNIYAGQNEVVGTVTIVDGMLTIHLNDGWELDPEESESVKIEGLEEIPDSRPIPGMSDLKGNSLTVDLSTYIYPYYAIHLDVRTCSAD